MCSMTSVTKMEIYSLKVMATKSWQLSHGSIKSLGSKHGKVMANEKYIKLANGTIINFKGDRVDDIISSPFSETYIHEEHGPLPFSSSVPFDEMMRDEWEWFDRKVRASGTSSAIALGQQLGKNNCIYCRCRIFDSDRFCPACGGPIYD